MPKVGKKEFDYTEKGKAEAKTYAKETGQEVEYPTYDAGGRVEVYREGGEVKPTSISKTSVKFQGTSKEVAKKMEKDPAFKAGMEKHYGVTLSKDGKLSKK
jgi:hypothetical protein